MRLSATIAPLLQKAQSEGVPFAVYRFPGSGEILTGGDFARTPWIGSAEREMPQASTCKADYVAGLERLIKQLRRDGGKAVVSRVICGEAADVDWAAVAEQLFERFPEAFCHLSYHPDYGYWLGATPELLVSYGPDGEFATMALAGTRTDAEAWDEKNILEHQMVVDDIAAGLKSLGTEFSIGERGELRYGAIRHLLTPFRGHAGASADFAKLGRTLSPTPAVAGYPRAKALEQIAQCETHDRGLYAGYVSVTDPAGTQRSYVNLRCLRFDPRGGYCIYAGGGITAMSVPESEWDEAQAKASNLLNIIQNNRK